MTKAHGSRRRGARPSSAGAGKARSAGARARARNLKIAEQLRQAAELIEAQDGAAYSVGAYRKAADAVASLDRDLGEIAKSGSDALHALPGVGPAIAGAIMEMLGTGRWSYLERLRGGADPERVFRMIPGIGPRVARLLHESLHVDTLESLDVAVMEGRLEKVEGLGHRRIGTLRAALAEILSRIGPRTAAPRREPAVDLLLDVDAEYRRRASDGTLKRTAATRSSTAGDARVPILHTRRGTWYFTALYSNTTRAHVPEEARDWVAIYFQSDEDREAQRMVVTEGKGPLEGRRVVCGHEGDCLAFYGAVSAPI
jgi:predicted flap endonuclease-1-like 5' DNA nuclease